MTRKLSKRKMPPQKTVAMSPRVTMQMFRKKWRKLERMTEP